jgi:hypothetical protein
VTLPAGALLTAACNELTMLQAFDEGLDGAAIPIASADNKKWKPREVLRRGATTLCNS